MSAFIRGYECIDSMRTLTCPQKWAYCVFCQVWRVPVSACFYLALIVGIAIIAACMKRTRRIPKSKIHIDWPKIRHMWLEWENFFDLRYIVCPTPTPLNLKQSPSVHSCKEQLLSIWLPAKLSDAWLWTVLCNLYIALMDPSSKACFLWSTSFVSEVDSLTNTKDFIARLYNYSSQFGLM